MSLKMAQYAVTTNPNKVVTSPSIVIPGREKDMVKSDGGSMLFRLDPFKQLERFLILGVDGGTYYADEKKRALRMYEGMKACISLDARRVVDLAVDVSEKGRASSNDPALLALAAVMAYASLPEDKFYARQALSKVARIGTHLFHFATFVDSMKGWGTGTRKAFQKWYLDKTADQIGFQAIKYKSRDKWSHRDILRKSHPFGDEKQNVVFDWIAHGKMSPDLPEIILAAEAIKNTTDQATVVKLIREFRLTWEMLPTEWLAKPAIWEALLPHMKAGAMIRNLGRLSSLGVVSDMSEGAKFVVQMLTNSGFIKNARVHPIAALNAQRVYAQGHGEKGSLAWKPVRSVIEALEASFYTSFEAVEPTGKNIMVALDVSASMTWNKIANTHLTPREASAVMAMVTVRAEPNYMVMGFTSGTEGISEIDIGKGDSLTKVIETIQKQTMGGTDCSRPMVHATKHKLGVDCFQIYTDNETNSGIQPSQAIRDFRKAMNKPDAKVVVAAMEVSNISIADPLDTGMLDVAGFDTSTPAAMANFVRG